MSTHRVRRNCSSPDGASIGLSCSTQASALRMAASAVRESSARRPLHDWLMAANNASPAAPGWRVRPRPPQREPALVRAHCRPRSRAPTTSSLQRAGAAHAQGGRVTKPLTSTRSAVTGSADQPSGSASRRVSSAAARVAWRQGQCCWVRSRADEGHCSMLRTTSARSPLLAIGRRCAAAGADHGRDDADQDRTTSSSNS